MRYVLILAVLIIASDIVMHDARSDVLSDARGMLTDPLKAGKASENLLEAVERAGIYAERIEGKLNDDATQRLAQMDTTIRETREFLAQAASDDLTKIESISLTAFVKVNQLQEDLFRNTRELIKCSTESSADIIQSKIAQSLNDLGVRRPRIALFGFTLFEVKFDKSDFPSPIEGFRQMKSLIDEKLKNVGPEASPSIITDAYGEIARMADLTRCNYGQDSAVYAELLEDDLEYTRRGKPWIGQVILR
jgi:hypothetical protein